MKRILWTVVSVLLIGALAFFVIDNYSFVFAKTVNGEILEIDRVTQPTAVIAPGGAAPAQLYSFAVAIKDKSGKIFTSSSEDRQWAVARKGHCVVAKFYPYPPWNFDKGGTFFNARLIELMEKCGEPAAAAASGSGQ